jgi:membrane protein DedA with SNARE-associated domain
VDVWSYDQAVLAAAHHVVQAAPHVHHRFTGPHADYVGVALAAFVSWFLIAGPGEAALIAAGIAAAHGKVDIVGMVLVAWAGAAAGGAVSWLIGYSGGRALLSRPGPLYRVRRRMLRHGDRLYRRRGWLAVYLAPAWMAGVAGMRARRFLIANAIATFAWALLVGGGAYLEGPAIAEAIGDLGTAGLVVLIAGAALSALVAGWRRARSG